MVCLYNLGMKRRVADFKMNARIQGCTFKDDDTSDPYNQIPSVDAKVPLFGDPAAYEELSEDERNEMTQKMQGKHKTWAGQGFLKG